MILKIKLKRNRICMKRNKIIMKLLISVSFSFRFRTQQLIRTMMKALLGRRTMRYGINGAMETVPPRTQ